MDPAPSTPRPTEARPASVERPTRLLIADDHESVRIGLKFLLAQESEFEVVGEASSVATTLYAIDALAPDIVVLDFGLGGDTADRVLDVLAKRPNAPRVLILSMEDERVVGQELARRGAAGYVMKQSPTSEIIAALRRIRTPPQSREAPPEVHLTARQREVLLLVKEGLPSKIIARRLHISEKTVDVHKHQLRRKLGLRTDMELVRHAALFASKDSADRDS
jgi:DNA-binding NarL/FixJ family response regulator